MIYTMTLNPALDYVMHPLTLDMGYTNRSSSEEIHCGGNGINISTLLNELDVPNIALGIAAGFTGNYLIQRLQEKGIASNFVRLDKGYTRINIKLLGVVMTIVNGMGPDIPKKKVDELLDRLDVVKSGDTVVLTGSIPKTLPSDIYTQIMNALSHKDIRFVVDAEGQLLIDSLEAHPFLIKPNNHEIGRTFNVDTETPEECMPYAHKLQELGAKNVIVSCGNYGSILVDEHGEEHTAACAHVRLVNATGAGDSMIAGFLAQYEYDHNYQSSLIFASACGTATAASKGIASRARVEQVFKALCKKMKCKAPATVLDTISKRIEESTVI